MVKSLLLVKVQEELNLREVPKPYILLVDEQIKERMRDDLRYIKSGYVRYVRINKSFVPKIGEKILQTLPNGLIDNYKIHPHTETFSYVPLAIVRDRNLGIEDEEDVLDYHFYSTTSKFRREKLYSLKDFRVIGITSVLYYCTFLEPPSKKYKLPFPPLVSHFKGGVTEKDSNVSLIAMIGNSFERRDTDLVKSTALTAIHELGHTWKLEHHLPHSGPCIMRVDEQSDKFCSVCLEKMLTNI